MTTQQLYDYITSQITPELALMKLLESSLLSYEKLKFVEGEEVSPVIIIAMAAMDLGWQIAIPKGDENSEVIGMVVGTEEYINGVFNDKHIQ